MGHPFLSHEQFLLRLKTNGQGYTLRAGEYEGADKKYDIVCPKHPENMWTPWGVNLLNNTTNCPICSAEKQSLEKRLSHEDVVKLFEDDGRCITIREGFKYTTNKDKLHLVCPHHPDYDWFTRPLDVVRDKKSCPVCVGKAPLSNEIIDKRLEGRNIKRVSEYTGKSKDSMLFECGLDGYTWRTKVSKVVSEGSGCPMCSGKMKWTNERVDDWLKENLPTVVRVGHTKGAQHQTKFRCLVDGYEWECQFNNIQRHGAGCPACSEYKHWNDELIDRWLQDNKKTFKRISTYSTENKTVWWKCDIDSTEWECRLHHVLKGQGCPECTGGGGFKTNEPGFLYYGLVTTKDSEYYKIGISNRNPKVRLNETKQHTELLHSWFFEIGMDARKVEQQILKDFKHLIQTEHTFSGSTECFIEDIRKYVDLDKFVCDNTQNQTENN